MHPFGVSGVYVSEVNVWCVSGVCVGRARDSARYVLLLFVCLVCGCVSVMCVWGVCLSVCVYGPG